MPNHHIAAQAKSCSLYRVLTSCVSATALAECRGKRVTDWRVTFPCFLQSSGARSRRAPGLSCSRRHAPVARLPCSCLHPGRHPGRALCDGCRWHSAVHGQCRPLPAAQLHPGEAPPSACAQEQPSGKELIHIDMRMTFIGHACSAGGYMPRSFRDLLLCTA